MTTPNTSNTQLNWNTAATPVFDFIHKQLARCKRSSMSGILVDNADIGKSYAAREFAKTNRHVAYIDCSQVKSKQRLVRAIARSFGSEDTGRYVDVYETLVDYINSLPRPLIILDEAGDLQYDAFLELKALWNATERKCGWYMMGADGLEAKIKRCINNKKVGYTELFSRFGKKFQRATPVGNEELTKFNMEQAALIIRANARVAGNDLKQMIARTQGSLRRVYNEVAKMD